MVSVATPADSRSEIVFEIVLEIITLPALQKHFVNIFSCLPRNFALKNGGGFGDFFLISVSHETKHKKSSKNSGKIRSKIRGKIRGENSKNSGNFRSAATFLTQEIAGAKLWKSSG